jgi:hypothetical protein
MANKNPWKKYLILLALALILWGVTSLKERKYAPSTEKIFDFTSDQVTEITVEKDTLSVTLVKNDTSWVFAAPDTGDVNQNKVTTFLENVIEEGTHTGFQTKNQDKYTHYEITDDLATKITLKLKNEKQRDLFVSRSKSNWSHDYIRYPKDPKVYITGKKIMYYFSEKTSFWKK